MQRKTIERLFYRRYAFLIRMSAGWLGTINRSGYYRSDGRNTAKLNVEPGLAAEPGQAVRPDHGRVVELNEPGTCADPTGQVARIIATVQEIRDADWLLCRCRDRLDIYLDNRRDWQSLIDQYETLITTVWSPRDDAEITLLQGNSHAVLRDQLFHGCYSHRISFRLVPDDIVEQVHDWCHDNFTDPNGRRAAWSRSPLRVYVQDDCDMLLLQLRFAPHILRIDQVILRPSA